MAALSLLVILLTQLENEKPYSIYIQRIAILFFTIGGLLLFFLQMDGV